ncbi:MAG: hypothetical protein ABI135_09510 [Rhodoferax sp.]
MESSPVLLFLQAQFPGQLVLYVDDVAKVLGKSKKAISNLIARKGLPFEIKTVGSHRCVDIFQVAQWLSSNPEIVQETVSEPAPAPAKRKRKSVAVPKTKAPSPLQSDVRQQPVGGMTSQILKMRHDYAAPLGRFVHGLNDPQEFLFMQEVLERLCFSADAVPQSYVVDIRKLAPVGAKALSEEQRKFFDTEPLASDYVLGKLRRSLNSQNKAVVYFVVSHAEETLFHAVQTGSCLTIVSNAIGYELAGL